MRLFGRLRRWFPKDGSQISSISILLETNILGPHPDRANQNLWEQCPAVCKHSRWFWGMLGFEHHWYKPPSCSVSSDLYGDLAFKLQHAPLIQTSSGMHDCHSSLSIHPGPGLRDSSFPWWCLCYRVLVIELAAARQAFGIQLPDLWFFSSSPRWRIENKKGEWLGVAQGKARVRGVWSSGRQPWLHTGVIWVFLV